MGVIIYSFNVNTSPTMPHGVVCDSYVTELHAHEFGTKDFVIKRGIICVKTCISSFFLKILFIFR